MLIPISITSTALEWPAEPISRAQSRIRGETLEIGNNWLQVVWSTQDNVLRPIAVRDLRTGDKVDLTNSVLFRLVLEDGQVIASTDLHLVNRPRLEIIKPDPDSPILAKRLSGQVLSAELKSHDARLRVLWRAILRNQANSVRQEFTFFPLTEELKIRETVMVDVPSVNSKVMGKVPGSPLKIQNLFFAYEHPDSRWTVGSRAIASLPFNLRLAPGKSVEQAMLIGVAPTDQIRRGFLYYVERERAHPYRPFPHYNAWYDICWGNRKISEQECLNVVNQFGQELTTRRGVALASYVWDDGWDDPSTLWRPVQTNFPHGFANILEAARANKSTLGFWLSPFGGYGTPKEHRIALGKQQGFETGPEGFSLAGPTYYARFLETCSRFIREDGANFFKFDGLARSVNETEAMLRLSRALRGLKPDLFISITTGTWPSPFWLWYGDSTWRGGDDMGFTGEGSQREQWITYRDAQTFKNVVQAAPLYPLNSLMTQGFAHARYGTASQVGNDDGEIRRELRSFFASGTCLQELYVTPEKMSSANWDDLAQGLRWAASNAETLVDSHWIGGDPGLGEIYGWAAWSAHKAILALRNPSATAKAIRLEAGAVFEVPHGYATRFALENPWRDWKESGLPFQAGEPRSFQLEPFEVRVFEAVPVKPQ